LHLALKSKVCGVSLIAFSIATALLLPQVTLAQTQISNQQIAQNYWPQYDYDPNVPTLKQVLGYENGEKITTPDDIIKYLEALHAYAPNRIIIKDYGKTWEGRRLIYAFVGSEQHISNLDKITANSVSLADPRKTNVAQKNSIISKQPVIVWYTNSVHGDEISPADASLRLAYHILAARGGKADEIRNNTLVAIVPLQNPDGRARFINSNLAATGANPNSDEFAAERDQPWPGGRMNHYNFDLNRDWFALTQPETQGQTKAFLQYYPQVVVDAHEMGREGNFFFPPEAEPINETHTQEQKDLRAIFGHGNAKSFDEYGIQYFTREIYDGFYPGYGDSWPTSQGAIAMTYEQASSRGLLARDKNGEILNYKDTVKNHFIASLATIETAASNRVRILNSFYEFRKSAIDEGEKSNIKSYIIDAKANKSGADKLAAVLKRQNIEITQAKNQFSICGKDYVAGSYIVPTNQPASLLVKNLLAHNIPLDAEFVKRQLSLRARGLNDEIYDVTGWSMPLLYNLDVAACGNIPNVVTNPVGTDFIQKGIVSNPNPKYGFVIASANNAFNRFVAGALRSNIKLRALDEEFTTNDVSYPSGSVVVINSENDDNLSQKIAKLADETGANIKGIDNSWVDKGPSFGSIKSVLLKTPKIAMAWDFPTSPYSAGNARFTLEQKIGFDVTPVRVSRLKMANINRFDAIILPDTNADYSTFLGEGGTNNLKQYVTNGGVLIGLGGATRFLAASNILPTKVETFKENKSENKNGEIKNDKDYLDAITPNEVEPVEIDGAILKIKKGENHWLTQGLPKEIYALYQGNDVYTPLTRAQGENPLYFAAKDELLASGLVWEENKAKMAYKPFAMVVQKGRGFVIGFGADPTYRAHTDGLDALLMNAVLQPIARVK
jgi:Zinc carboxypeptidase